MLRHVFILALALAVAGPVLAQEKPPMDLPIYDGAETTLELNLTNEDFIPILEAALPMLGKRFGKLTEKIDVNDVASILKDMKRFEFVQLEIARPAVKCADVVRFYSEHLPAGKWNRALFQSAEPVGTVAVYTQDSLEGIYIYRVWSTSENGKTTTRAMVARTEGKIDFVKLVSLAGKVFNLTPGE